MTPYNQIFQMHAEGANNSEIERCLGTVTRKTIITALKLADEMGFAYQPDEKSDTEIHRILHPKKDKAQREPNIERSMFLLSLPNQSIAKVWTGYIAENSKGYGKSSFQTIIRENKSKYPLPKYESVLELRFIKAAFVDEEEHKVSCLFARLRHSGTLFFVTFDNAKARTWIHAIIRIIHSLHGMPDEFCFIGNVPKAVFAETEDCLRYYGAELTKTKRSSADPFQAWIGIALKRLNSADKDSEQTKYSLLCDMVAEYNEQAYFETTNFTRRDAWREECKVLRPVPDEDYDLLEYTDVRVQMNRHIEVDGCYYSVPFKYRHEKLTAYLTDRFIEVCYLDTIICVHDRLKDGSGRYSTLPEHIVPDYKVPFGETSGKSLRSWAKKIGPYTERAIDFLLHARTYEIQAYKICDTILHLSTLYGYEVLENSCKNAIEAKHITYQEIKNACKSQNDKGNK